MTTQGSQRRLPSANPGGPVLGQFDQLAIELLTQIWDYIYDKGRIPQDLPRSIFILVARMREEDNQLPPCGHKVNELSNGGNTDILAIIAIIIGGKIARD